VDWQPYVLPTSRREGVATRLYLRAKRDYGIDVDDDGPTFTDWTDVGARWAVSL
jgi:hypothetical protein